MSKFVLPILAAIVGGIFAAVIDSPPSDEILSNSKLKRDIKDEENQFNANNFNFDFPKIDFPTEPPPMPPIDWTELNKITRPEHFDFDLTDFMNCTKIQNGYIKYDGTSSCVNTYNDAACTDGESLSMNAEYSIGSFRTNTLKVCNKARDVKLYICLVFGTIGLAVWICLKCRQCQLKRSNSVGSSTANLVF